jgi:hypothetical protein
MDVKKILTGAVIWSLGLFVPALHHGLLAIAASNCRSHTYPYHSLTKYFFDLPWVDGVFLVVMCLVGLILVISGFRPESCRR